MQDQDTPPFFIESTGREPHGTFLQENPFEPKPPVVAEVPFAAPRAQPNRPASNYELFLAELKAQKAAHTSAAVAQLVGYGTNKVINYAQLVVRRIVDDIKTIAAQAFHMALFKFAIEACAMMIKQLVETMSGMKLTPPNIDTQGIYYNFNNVRPGGTPPNGPQSSTPRYENPFAASPFQSSSPAW